MSLDLFQISPQHFQVLFFDFKLAYFQMSAQLQPMQTCYQIGQNRKWFSNGMCFEQTPGTTELTERALRNLKNFNEKALQLYDQHDKDA